MWEVLNWEGDHKRVDEQCGESIEYKSNGMMSVDQLRMLVCHKSWMESSCECMNRDTA